MKETNRTVSRILFQDSTSYAACQSTVESDLHTSRKCRWNPDYYDEAKGVLLSCLENLNITSESVDVECQNTIDTAVDQFTSQLSKAFEPFFEIKIKPVNKHRKTAYSTVMSIDKPWWTAEAQRKYNTYRRDLFLFNRNKTESTHECLLRSKKEYKVLTARLKRQYQQAEGNMLDFLRKSNPKAFYRNFRGKQRQQTNINPSVFYEHFKNIAHAMNASEKSTECIDADPIFEELDCPITEKEIVDAIKRLKKEKSHGTDLLINEYFIEFKDYLVPIILRLFNRILSSGFFPNMWAQCNTYNTSF